MLKRPRLKTRKEPRQPRAVQTREDILDAATRCMRAEGIDVSMTRIAEVSGYSIGTVYQYFPDRASLLCELQCRVSEQTLAVVMAELPAFAALPLREGIARIVRAIVTSAAENRALTAAVFRDVIPVAAPEDWEDLLPAFSALLSAQLRAKEDELRHGPIEMLVFFTLQSVEAIVERAAVEHPEWLDDPAFSDELCRLVSGYLVESA
jgi:AcrR family transcriptional regulator